MPQVDNLESDPPSNGQSEVSPDDTQAKPEKRCLFRPFYQLCSGWLWFWKQMVTPVATYLGNLIKTLSQTLGGLLMLIFKTPYMLLPSATHSMTSDGKYDTELAAKLKELVNKLDLDPSQQATITDCWLDQIKWTGGRATRERSADELIRWWIIVLGVLVPVLINGAGANTAVLNWASVFGVLIAVMTAIYQFRRPEERWRHYRKLHEQYLIEFWRYISLTGDYAPRNQPETEQTANGESRPSDHQKAFPLFNEKMLQLREEDVSKFFGEVVADLSKQIDEVTKSLSSIAPQPPGGDGDEG